MKKFAFRSFAKLLPFSIGGLAAILIYLAPQPAVNAQAPFLDLEFDNLSSFDGTTTDKTVYLYFSNPNGVNNPTAPSSSIFDISYNTSLTPVFDTYTNSSSQTVYNALSNPVALHTVTNSTFQITNASSVAVYLAFGSEFDNLDVPPGFFSDSVGGNTVFQNFEITRLGGNGDQGNLTNINYFTAPMSITSFAGAAQQQQTGFSKTTAQLYSALDAISPASKIVDGSGTTLRFVGPSTYLPAQTPPFPSFLPYAQAAADAAAAPTPITNDISNVNAFINTDSDNIQFTFNLETAYTTDGSGNVTAINLNGSVEAWNTTADPGRTNVQTFSATNLTIHTTNVTDFDGLVYGQNADQYPSTVDWATGWDTLETAMINEYKLSSGNYQTLQGTVIGEITSAMLMGFLANTMVVDGTPLNEMLSSDWWKLNPMQAFDAIQPTNPYYNVWANEIYEASNNGSYSIPFSDRLGSGPLVNSVNFDGNDITKWVVGFSDPVSVIPEPSTSAIALLGISALWMLRRMKKAKV